ncbi:MAG: 30S ribosomal protein S30e [Candidatus Methylarchaceae archaeon HK02M2]|nr:30S ribosomal protein S30e [Candidatus Methylarchaceae archaeon HK02M2]
MPTHGSLTKAGKVRSATPKLEARKKIAPIPKSGNRKKFIKRFFLERRPGQNWLS